MGAYLKTTGKIFLGLTAASLAVSLFKHMTKPSEPESEFSAPARALKRAAEKGSIYDFEEVIDRYIPDATAKERKQMWLTAGGDPKWTTLVG